MLQYEHHKGHIGAYKQFLHVPFFLTLNSNILIKHAYISVTLQYYVILSSNKHRASWRRGKSPDSFRKCLVRISTESPRILTEGFFSPLQKTPGSYLLLGHNRFFSSFLVHQASSHSTLHGLAIQNTSEEVFSDTFLQGEGSRFTFIRNNR
jgi:hypothetical protein